MFCSSLFHFSRSAFLTLTHSHIRIHIISTINRYIHCRNQIKGALCVCVCCVSYRYTIFTQFKLTASEFACVTWFKDTHTHPTLARIIVSWPAVAECGLCTRLKMEIYRIGQVCREKILHTFHFNHYWFANVKPSRNYHANVILLDKMREKLKEMKWNDTNKEKNIESAHSVHCTIHTCCIFFLVFAQYFFASTHYNRF